MILLVILTALVMAQTESDAVTRLHVTDGNWQNCELACQCDEKSKAILCSGASLKFVPLGIPEDTETLTLSGNNFAVIGQEFRFLSKLKSINLQKSRINQLSEKTFENTTSLVSMDLSHNYFTGVGIEDTNSHNDKYNFTNTIPSEAFSKLDKLAIMDLTFCHISFIGKQSFVGLGSLQKLDLSFNYLTDLTGHAFDQLTSVKVLNIHANQIHSIGSDIFERNAQLEQLDLAKNHIKWFPADLLRASGGVLRELILEHNEIVAVKDLNLDYLVSLHVLDLSINRIETVKYGDFTMHMDKLQQLKLSKNEITTIDEGVFSHLKKLSQLDLSYNRLRVC